MPHTPTVGILQIYSLSEIGGPLYYFTKSTSKHKWNNNNCWNSMKQVVPPPRNDNILMMSLSQPHNNKCTLCLIHVFSWHTVKQKYIGLRSVFHIAPVLSTPTVGCLWVSFLQSLKDNKLIPLNPPTVWLESHWWVIYGARNCPHSHISDSNFPTETAMCLFIVFHFNSDPEAYALWLQLLCICWAV